ncbi:MAG: YhfC family glutamic-type intramembrane protease, partial [Dehalococcoidia bacterium]
MLIRGLLISAQGFLFIFLPAYVIAFFLRKWREIDRSLFWLGALSLLVAQLPINFLLSLSRHMLPQGEAFWIPFMPILIGSLLSGFFEETSKWGVLRLKRVRGEDLLTGGMAVGLGAGFIAKIFLGIALVGVGMRLTFGDASTATLREIAATPLAALSLKALASLADHLALLILNACLGFLVARAILKGRKVLFLYAVLIHSG